jgi:uncharacterized protein (DUF2126 family)
MTDETLADVRQHDAALRARGLEIWIGAEPTFTRRESQEPWWLGEAEGGDKEEHARALLRALALRLPHRPRLVKVPGRQFPEEPKPRFCLGAQWPRDPRVSFTPAADGLEGEPAAAPPHDPALAWLTVTPDPGVVEVNMAPAPDLETFLQWSRGVYAAAADAGLSAVRYRWNGQVVDSGGGGQITLGGPSPEASPFFRHPHLLPGLLRYANRHPSLSYWFATECVGSSSQGPRPDEGVRERFDELPVALAGLGRGAGERSPEELWRALAPLLVDCSGNSHRAELNIEKLWNPYLAERGCQGLVEFRALRMERTPERMAAVGALLRALAARLVATPYDEPFVDWGAALHDRFALPAVLEDDLREVLADLQAHGVGLGPALARAVLDPPAPIGRVRQGAATLTVTPALEYWPLVGDVASAERRGARLLDTSTKRLQVMIEAPAGEEPGEMSVGGWTLSLSALSSRGEGSGIAGVRYRAFVPGPGLHPRLPASDPLILTWVREGHAFEVVLHGWIPGGGTYAGLPADAAEAARRREERVVIRSASSATAAPAAPPARARSAFTLDVRRCAPW